MSEIGEAVAEDFLNLGLKYKVYNTANFADEHYMRFHPKVKSLDLSGFEHHVLRVDLASAANVHKVDDGASDITSTYTKNSKQDSKGTTSPAKTPLHHSISSQLEVLLFSTHSIYQYMEESKRLLLIPTGRGELPPTQFEVSLLLPRIMPVIYLEPSSIHILKDCRWSESSNPEIPAGTLVEAISSERRITTRNIMKWSFQLLSTIMHLHKNYMTIGEIDLGDVYLESDLRLQETLADLKHRIEDGKEFLPSGDEDDYRNAWISLHKKLRCIDLTSEDDRKKKSEEKEKEKEPKKMTRPCHCYGELLRRFDKAKTGSVIVEKREKRFVDVAMYYSDWANGVQRDFRCLGMILLQLVAHRVLPAREKAALFDRLARIAVAKRMDLYYSRATDGGIDDDLSSVNSNSSLGSLSSASSLRTGTKTAASSKVSLSVSYDDDVDAKADDDENESGEWRFKKRSAEEVAMVELYPSLSKLPVYLKDFIIYCFQPRQPVLQTEMERSTSFKVLHFSYEFYNLAINIHETLRTKLLGEYDDVTLEKKQHWTDEDERIRQLEIFERSEELALKAKEGVKRAAQRVEEEKYKLWYSLQTDEWKVEMARRERAIELSAKNRRERRKLVRWALVHFWPTRDFRLWIQEAMSSYMLSVCEMKIAADIQAQNGKASMPEVYIQHHLRDVFDVLFCERMSKKIIERYDPLMEEVLQDDIRAQQGQGRSTTSRAPSAAQGTHRSPKRSQVQVPIDKDTGPRGFKSPPVGPGGIASSPPADGGGGGSKQTQPIPYTPYTQPIGEGPAKKGRATGSASVNKVKVCITIIAREFAAFMIAACESLYDGGRNSCSIDVIRSIKRAKAEETVATEQAVRLGKILVITEDQFLWKKLSGERIFSIYHLFYTPYTLYILYTL